MRKILILLLLITLLMVACDKAPKVPEIDFRVNQKLLASAIVDSTYNYSYQPPLGWEIADNVIMEAIKFQMNRSDTNLLRNLNVFIAPEKKGFIAGSVILDDAGVANERFTNELKDKYPEMSFAEYKANDLYFYQYKFTNENNFVSIKLLIPLNEMQTAMFDIFIDKDFYVEKNTIIESVIGSIKRI